MNILDDVENIVSPAGSLPLWKVRAFVLPDCHFDLVVIPLCREAQTPEATSLVINRLRASELVADTKPRKKHQVHVRIDTASLAGRGAKLEAGEFPSSNDLEAGESYVVHFCDPNATKALHVGHLRNIALGNAIASALAYAGATVQRRSVVGDIGRNMAETMAALWPIRDTISAELANGREKADHLVGRLYARGASTEKAEPAPASPADMPLKHEIAVRHDLADEMLLQMLQSDGEVVHTWHAVRDSVVTAQLATLASLGVKLDRVVLESTYIDKACAIAKQGVLDGLFVREPDGAITYRTGRSDFASLPLIRSDGVPTQHMRTIVYWVLAHAELRESQMIRVCGEEWRPHTLSTQNLLSSVLRGDHGAHRAATIVFHSMVTIGDDVVKSRNGDGLLIDDWLAQIESQVDSAMRAPGATPQLAKLCPANVAVLVALGFFLTRPSTAIVDFRADVLLSAHGSLGWLLALSRSRECLPITSDYEAANDPAYRFAVIQAETMRHHLQLIVTQYDVVPLARYLNRLARWYIQRERSASVANVISAILDQGSIALGLQVK
jgi:arginyl-tRNA synthetase